MFRVLTSSLDSITVELMIMLRSEADVWHDWNSGTRQGLNLRRKDAWLASGFSTPAPLGHPRFDPNKPIIYNLGDANGTGLFNPFANTPYTTKNAQGQTVTLPGFVANGQTYTPNAAQQAASNEPSEPLAELGVAPGASATSNNSSPQRR